MLNSIREWMILFILCQIMKGGDIMDERIKKAFATTFVHLILAGRRTIADVPAGLLDLVKADLGLTETAPATQPVEAPTAEQV